MFSWNTLSLREIDPNLHACLSLTFFVTQAFVRAHINLTYFSQLLAEPGPLSPNIPQLFLPISVIFHLQARRELRSSSIFFNQLFREFDIWTSNCLYCHFRCTTPTVSIHCTNWPQQIRFDKQQRYFLILFLYSSVPSNWTTHSHHCHTFTVIVLRQ